MTLELKFVRSTAGAFHEYEVRRVSNQDILATAYVRAELLNKEPPPTLTIEIAKHNKGAK